MSDAIEAAAVAIDMLWSEGQDRGPAFSETEREYQEHCRATARAAITAYEAAKGEIKRAQEIIDGLKAFREFCLTQAVNADEIQMIMADQWPDAEALPYVAVKIAEAIDKRIQGAPYLAAITAYEAAKGGEVE
jgi:hypothetical protein